MLLHFWEAVSRATGAPLLRAWKPHHAGGGAGKLRAAARDQVWGGDIFISADFILGRTVSKKNGH